MVGVSVMVIGATFSMVELDSGKISEARQLCQQILLSWGAIRALGG